MRRLLGAIAVASALLGLLLEPMALAQTNPGQPPKGAVQVGNGIGARPTFGGDVYFDSGRPWCDVRAQHGTTPGAKGDGVTDDAPAFKACRVALDAQGGGYLFAPSGNYCLKTVDANGAAVSITSTAITVAGIGLNGTNLWTCGADVTLVYANVVGAGIVNLSYAGKGAAQNPNETTFGATKPAFKFDASCGLCRIDNVRGFGGFYALDNLGFDTWVQNFSFGSTYGGAIMHEAGNGHRVMHGALDQNWPVVLPNQNSLTVSAWQSAHSYTGNGAANTNVVSTQGYNIQLVSAGPCTSGSSAPTLQNYGTAITDGACTWQLVGATTYWGDHCDGNCVELHIHGEVDMNCGGCTANFAMINSNGGSTPNIAVIDGSSIGQAISEQILLHDGSSFTLVNSHLSTASATNASAVNVGPNAFTGGATITGNRFSGAGNCIAIGLAPSGQAGYSISNNRFNSCTTAIDFFAAAAAVHITASNNTMIAVTTAFTVPAGSSFYQFTHNDVNGAAVSFTAGDANKAVYGNDGSAIPNASLANSATTVNGQTCTLGSTCTITSSLTAGSSGVSGGTTGQLLFDNAGVLGEVTKCNNGAYITNGSGTPSCGAVPNANLANASTTVGGNTCTLGSSCQVRLFLSQSNSSVAAGATVFCSNVGGCNASAATTTLTLPVGQTSTFKNLNVNLAQAPAAAQSVTVTLFTGVFGSLVASALTCTVAASTTTCTDNTHSVSLTAGQSYSWQIVTGATNATNGSSIGVEQDLP